MKECKESNKFVCIAAEKINFLIPSSQVQTSVYCNGESYFWDDKFVFENNTIPFIDFYNDNSTVEYFGDVRSSETALILKNEGLFDDSKYFALITSKECSVMNVKYKDFSLFSKKFQEDFKKKGFVACYFYNDKVFYLINIEVFIKNFLM